MPCTHEKIMTMVTAFTRPSRKKEWQCPGSDLGISWPGSRAYDYWRDACEGVEIRYFDMLAEGCTPQEARSVLPNSLKTEVVMTANIREWRHFLKLRCSPAAHPQMREVALILLEKVNWLIPVCFNDIWSEYHADV
jgi:thymidylate synthase ThyX